MTVKPGSMQSVNRRSWGQFSHSIIAYLLKVNYTIWEHFRASSRLYNGAEWLAPYGEHMNVMFPLK